jgi:LPXTG-motif cell wall-anchored protein
MPVRKGTDVAKKLFLVTLTVASAVILVAALVPSGYDGRAYIEDVTGAGAATAPAPVGQASPAPRARQNATVARTVPTYASGQGQGASGGNGYGSGSGGSGSDSATQAGGSGSGAAAGDGWTTLSASMTGDVEVPGPGAPGATGQAAVRIKGSQLCFRLSWSGIEATAGHIHRGAPGAAGPIVVPFFKSATPLAGDSSTGCLTVAQALARELVQRPGSFYANVHTIELPAGAVRGQLALAGGAGAANRSLPLTGAQSRSTLVVGLVAVGCGFLLVTFVRRRRRPALAGRHARGTVRR